VKKFIGPLILICVAAVFVFIKWFGAGDVIEKTEAPEEVTISLYVGGEKMSFLKNKGVNDILLNRYGITLNATKAGSIEMVTTLAAEGNDALWPSNQIAVEIFRKRGGQVLSEENIFNSPLVFYAYDIVTEALIKEKIVEKRGPSYYVVDLPKLVRYIKEEKTWKDIGLPQLYGKLAIISTDPRRSNSGNMFAGLLANMFNGGTVVTPATLQNVLPELREYFSHRGYMEHSSGDIFKNFITTGVGARPLIAGYENQLVEFSLENEKYIDYLREKIRTLYPEPTLWSSHPIIALTPKGKRLIEAMKDEDIQKIVWESHGFRSGFMEVENDPSVLKVAGIPKEITAVIPLPDAEVMQQIIETLSQ
jgi:hypothetical protein